MKIFFDDELLTVEERKNHRDSHSGRIVERMKEGSREEDLFLHAILERGIYTKPRFICQSLRTMLILPAKFSNVMRNKRQIKKEAR